MDKIRNVPWISSDVIPGYGFHQGYPKMLSVLGNGSHSRIPVFRWMNNPFTIHSAYRFTIHAPLKSRKRKHVCFLLTDENPSQPASTSYWMKSSHSPRKMPPVWRCRTRRFRRRKPERQRRRASPPRLWAMSRTWTGGGMMRDDFGWYLMYGLVN